MSALSEPVLLAERRRHPRIASAGHFAVQMAIRTRSGTSSLRVRDVSAVGFGLTAARPLPVAAGERVYLLVDFFGEPAMQGVLMRARVRRRLPDRDGWFVGVEIDDLHHTPWAEVAAWIEARVSRG